MNLYLYHNVVSLLFHSLARAKSSTITVTATTTETTSAYSPTSSSYTSNSTFQTDMLVAHNFYREEQDAPALSWNDTSAAYAVRWAERCEFVHSVSFFFVLSYF